MRFEAKTVDSALLRYITCGDWRFLTDTHVQITVPEYGARHDNAFLVALHELVEAWICRNKGITEQQVTCWDVENPHLEEPGDHPSAPYSLPHRIAMIVEKIVAEALEVDWDEHQKWVEASAAEVERNIEEGVVAHTLTSQGPRFWAELHLFAMRHQIGGKQIPCSAWFEDWAASLPFGNCPCKEHFDAFIKETPPDWEAFFDWSVRFHNSVNFRIGKPIIDPEDAWRLWNYRSF